jgi:hypothetical protein
MCSQPFLIVTGSAYLSGFLQRCVSVRSPAFLVGWCTDWCSATCLAHDVSYSIALRARRFVDPEALAVEAEAAYGGPVDAGNDHDAFGF